MARVTVDVPSPADPRLATRRRSGRAGTVATALVLVVGLTACVPHSRPSNEPTTMNAAQAHDELATLLEDAQSVVGGEWKSIDGGAEICTTAAGKPGVVYPFGRLGPGVPGGDQQAMLDRVVAAWKSSGFTAVPHTQPSVKGVEIREVRYPDSGYGEDGIYLIFSVSVNGSTIDAQSRCVPGNADQINQDRQKQG